MIGCGHRPRSDGSDEVCLACQKDEQLAQRDERIRRLEEALRGVLEHHCEHGTALRAICVCDACRPARAALSPKGEPSNE